MNFHRYKQYLNPLMPIAERKNYKLILFSILTILFGVVFLLGDIQAQTPDVGMEYVEGTGLKAPAETDIRVAIANVVRYLLTFVGLIAVIFILYAGYLWMVSGGDPAKVDKAKKTLINAAIGLIIIIFSFTIVTVLINIWTDFTQGGPDRHRRPPSISAGMGAIGSCTIRSVYPEPGQRDVPRNTALIVTFSETVDPATICGSANCNNTQIIPDRVRLYERALGDSCAYDSGADLWTDCPNTNVVAILASSNDNQTFFFMPASYIGSPSAHIWYTAYLSNEIRLADGRPAFDTCAQDFFAWEFEVSNRVDLDPPIVISNGVFPPPDNEQDATETTVAVRAEGIIGITGDPVPAVDATAGAPVAQGTSPAAALSGLNTGHSQSGTLLIAVESGASLVSVRNQGSGALLGSYSIAGSSVLITNLFTLTFAALPAAGNSWTVAVSASSPADSLRVGSRQYRFVSGTPGDGQIQAGSGFAANQNNIINAINSGPHPEVEALADPLGVRLRARSAGAAGNAIVLSANSAALNITPMSGGLNAGTTLVPHDLRDKPRNSAIQVTFNEAVNPLTVSGPAQDLAGYIRVVCASGACSGAGIFPCPGGGNCLDGEFVISNQYRTVEFISNNQCGANSCGDPVYCLPPSSNLRVDIRAADLAGCDNCSAKSPYTGCIADSNGNSHCYNPADSAFHPLSGLAMNGIMDTAMNSLDGNRSGAAEGPIAYYNENSPSPAGDSYLWSFWISSELDVTPPQINRPDTITEVLTPGDTDGTLPLNAQGGVSPIAPIVINFNKLMMSSTLSSGQRTIQNRFGPTVHRLINLRNFSNYPTGYWVTSANEHIGIPDNEPEYTRAELRHTGLGNSMTYRAQVGSGVRDIYQNCFLPSAGPACWNASESEPSCCSGALSDQATCP